MNQQNIYRKYANAASLTFALNTAGSVNRKTGATLASNDFKVLRHTGGVWNVANPTTTTPTEIGTSGVYVLPLTATELTPDDLQYPVIMAAHDVAGAEWDDVIINIYLGYVGADVEAWVGSAPNALISGRIDANAQIVADKTLYTLTVGDHTAIAADVLNAVAASYNTAGTIGAKINTSGSLADPWSTALPGSYGAGTAGYIAGTNLNAQVSAVKTQTDKMTFSGANINAVAAADSPGVTTLLSRLTSTRATYLDLINTYLNATISSVYSLVNAVKAKTDNLPTDPSSAATVASEISAAEAAILADTLTIKNKTNNLPSSPAAVGSQMDLVNAPNSTAVTAIQSGLATAANLTTALNRLGAWTGSGANNLLGAFRALLRKDSDAAAPSDINTNLGSGAGTFDNTTDSNEAIADAVSGIGGGAAPTAVQNANAVWDAVRSAHTNSGSFGQGVASVQGAVTGAVASVTGNVGGNVVGDVNGNVAGNINGNVVGNVTGTVADSSGVTTLLTRLSSTRAGYLDVLAGWSGTLLNALKALMRKDATASADIGGTYLPLTDSNEALREKVDTITATGTTTENVNVTELNT